jgi:general stress protein 26
MSQEALKKTILEFVKTYEYSNLITIDDSEIPKGRMMVNLPLEEDCIFWFATGAQSNKVKEIERNPKASVFVYRPSDHSSVSALGNAEIVTDETMKKKYWQEGWKTFWPNGPSDPGYTLIKVVPQKIDYLDYPNHKQETLEL